MGKEQQPGRGGPDRTPLEPFELPPELAEFLARTERACVLQASDRGTVMVVKLPGQDIESVVGRVPIHLRHELYEHPLAPVIRTVVRIYDQPQHPLGLECYTNIEHKDMANEFSALAGQEGLLMLFYDERLEHQLIKQIDNTATDAVTQILEQATALRDAIPQSKYDFDRAKADVMRATRL